MKEKVTILMAVLAAATVLYLGMVYGMDGTGFIIGYTVGASAALVMVLAVKAGDEERAKAKRRASLALARAARQRQAAERRASRVVRPPAHLPKPVRRSTGVPMADAINYEEEVARWQREYDQYLAAKNGDR